MFPPDSATTVPQSPANWPIKRDALLVGYIDRVFYVLIGQNLSDQDRDVFVRELARGIDERKESDRVAVIYCVAPKFGSSIELLRGISRVVLERKDKVARTSLGLAMCTRSPFGRAGLRTVLVLGKLSYPTRVFDAPQAAFTFLNLLAPDLESAKVFERLRQHAFASAPALAEQIFGSPNSP